MFPASIPHLGQTAVSNPAKSWNHWGKRNPNLLDHEQGHFDITQIHAQRLEIKMRKMVAAKKPPAGTGESEAAAAEALNALLEKECEAAKAAALGENRDDARGTGHGAGLERE